VTTLNDAILAATGGPTINDGLRAHYLAGGATGGDLNDLERQYLLANGATGGALEDLWLQALTAAGYTTGSLNDRLLAFWIAGGQFASFQLNFAADTFIQLPSGPFDASKGSKLEYVCRNDDTTVNRDAWGTDSGQSYGRFRTADFRAFRSGTGGNIGAIAHVQGVEYASTEDVATPGTINVTMGALGPASAGVAATGLDTGAWRIGGRLTGTGWVGLIKDFKIYDESSILIHHWPINEGSGTNIVDIVGGLNGTLTLGSGTWVPRT
jgi:hypothetical protein